MIMIHDQHHGKPEMVSSSPVPAGPQHWIEDPDSNDIIGHLKEGTLEEPAGNPYAVTDSSAEGSHNIRPTPAEDIILWAAETFKDGLVMSTSFGIQAAVMLHLVTEIAPNIPVIWIDTGYFPTQTYLFAEQLTKRLRLNLKVYQPAVSPARMEALYGKPCWHRYHQIRQVEPMQRALQALEATAWLIGVCKRPAPSLQPFHVRNIRTKCYKVLPMLHWQVQDIQEYIRVHDLPEHPFFELSTVKDGQSSELQGSCDRNKCDRNFPVQESQADGSLSLLTTPQAFQSLDSSSL